MASAPYIRSANPIWYLPDLTGLPLNDMYFAFFLQNVFPYLPQPVYQDNQGIATWTNPLQFYPNGTLPQNLYFNPNLVYLIQIRMGNTMDAQLIYEIPNYVPSGGGSPVPSTTTTSENQITNPQFANINFSSPHTITSAGTYNIAPGWNLVLTGSGSTTLTQEIFSGSENIVNNPPFGLQITNSGWTTAILQQTFTGNGALWANQAVAVSVTALGGTVNQPLIINYVPSVGTTQTILSTQVLASEFNEYTSAIVLPASTNTNLSNVASVSLAMVLPINGMITITNIQLIGEELPIAITFQQETPQRILDHEFNVYANELIIKPKASIVAGWNFALNPFQYNPVAQTATSVAAQYVCDQTIIYQQTAGLYTTGQAAIGNNQVLSIVNPSGATPNQFAIFQYIDPNNIRPYWSYLLSCLVRARIFTTASSLIPIKMRLIYRTSLPPSISATEPIASWSVGQDPVFQTGWTALTPLNDPSYILPNAYSTFESPSQNAVPAFAFDQFQMPTNTNANMTLGVMVYTMANTAINDQIIFDRISLVPNKFAVDSPPQTYDEVLRECQFYYEKSYDLHDEPGSATFNGVQISNQLIQTGSGVSVMYAQSFGFAFHSLKRTITPIFNFYSPASGAIDFVLGQIRLAGTTLNSADVPAAAWSIGSIGNKNIFFIQQNITAYCNVSNADDRAQAFINYHYTADYRLGE